MKILVVQDRLRSGGTERQSVLLAHACADAGHAVTLLTFRPGGKLDATVDRTRVARIVLQPFDTGLDWFAPGLAGRAARLQPDVILCMGRMANCYAGGLQRRLPRAAVIATMRTGKPLPRLFRRSLQLVRHVVANSRDARDFLVRAHGVPTEKISVIYNSLVFPSAASPDSDGSAVPSPRLPAAAPATPAADPGPDVRGVTSPRSRSSAAEALRARYAAAPSTVVLLCVAMFRTEKRQRELIEIAAGLPPTLDWQLWLAGDGPERVACEQLTARIGLAARVKFTGFLRDPAPLYAAADVAVHASTSESLSNFLIEAQAHGLPVVASAAQGNAECCLPGETGWIVPAGDREGFRAALVRLAAETPEVRLARAAAARTFARTTFDPKRQSDAYLDLFTRLISPSGL
jgi:glycosyltransferase involved in cell wall biosynthesis